MTPFGQKVRNLRDQRGITLKKMATDLHVSSAYLSALEHGHRGRPAPGLVMQIAGYLDLIWDDVEDLKRLAGLSHPRVPVETAGLSVKATLAANLLAAKIKDLDGKTLDQLIRLIEGEKKEE